MSCQLRDVCGLLTFPFPVSTALPPFRFKTSIASMGGLPTTRQHTFALGITLSSELFVSLVFRRLAFASCSILYPLRIWPFLAIGLLVLADLIGISLFRIVEKRRGREPTIHRGLWCVQRAVPCPFSCLTRVPYRPSFWGLWSRCLRRFTFVLPFCLHLALIRRMDRLVVRRLSQLHTFGLPQTHVRLVIVLHTGQEIATRGVDFTRFMRL